MSGFHKGGHDSLNNKIAKCFQKHFGVSIPATARQLGVDDTNHVPDLVCKDTIGNASVAVYFDTTISKNMKARIREKVDKYAAHGFPGVRVLAFSPDLCVDKDSYITLKRYTKLT